jgi:hypothetical protein
VMVERNCKTTRWLSVDIHEIRSPADPFIAAQAGPR